MNEKGLQTVDEKQNCYCITHRSANLFPISLLICILFSHMHALPVYPYIVTLPRSWFTILKLTITKLCTRRTSRSKISKSKLWNVFVASSGDHCPWLGSATIRHTNTMTPLLRDNQEMILVFQLTHTIYLWQTSLLLFQSDALTYWMPQLLNLLINAFTKQILTNSSVRITFLTILISHRSDTQAIMQLAFFSSEETSV